MRLASLCCARQHRADQPLSRRVQARRHDCSATRCACCSFRREMSWYARYWPFAYRWPCVCDIQAWQLNNARCRRFLSRRRQATWARPAKVRALRSGLAYAQLTLAGGCCGQWVATSQHRCRGAVRDFRKPTPRNPPVPGTPRSASELSSSPAPLRSDRRCAASSRQEAAALGASTLVWCALCRWPVCTGHRSQPCR
jgi:hypothetical protein